MSDKSRWEAEARVWDREVFEEHCEVNALHRRLGIPELPLGVDPKDHAG